MKSENGGMTYFTNRSRRDTTRMIVTFYVVGALLNGPALLRTAERLEHGGVAQRALVSVVRPLASLSRSLYLDRFRIGAEWIAERWYGDVRPSPSAAQPAGDSAG